MLRPYENTVQHSNIRTLSQMVFSRIYIRNLL
jgi:hypothetical protein